MDPNKRQAIPIVYDGVRWGDLSESCRNAMRYAYWLGGTLPAGNAEVLGGKIYTTVGTLLVLERRGLVTTNVTDRGFTYATLTQTGRELVQSTYTNHSQGG